MPGRPWSNEIELLLACARPRLREQDRTRAHAAAAAGLDWPTLVKLADAHGLLPLLHRHLGDDALDAPPDAKAAIRARATEIVSRNLQLTAELLGILRDCAAAGIPAVPLKGPVLAETAYGSIALRRFGDLDLLVRRADLPAVSTLLTARCYQVDPLPPSGDAFLLENKHQISANLPRHRVHVEIHYTLLLKRGRAMRTFESVADRLCPTTFHGTAVQVLSPEDNIVYLCEHGAAHAWGRLEWLAGAVELMGRPSVDWTRVRRLAVEGRARCRVQAALDLATTLLGVSPARAFGAPSIRIRRANKHIVDRLCTAPQNTGNSSWESYRYQALTDADVSAALHRAWMTFAMPAPYDLDALPAGWRTTPLKYAARPFGLLKRWYSHDRTRHANRQGLP